MKRLLLLLCAPGALLFTGCDRPGCLNGDEDDCTVPSPCEELAWSCDDQSLSVGLVQGPDDVPGGLGSLGSPGDFVLRNSRVHVVLDALDHPHYLAPSGGTILDFATTGSHNDSMRNVMTAGGVLPDETPQYTEARIIEEPGLVAVQFRGTMDGRPGVAVATRYELRACEPGVRVRTELVNLEADPAALLLSDGWYLGDRELKPFAPGPGLGFPQPSFGLSTLGDALRTVPFAVYAGHSEPAAAYGSVACQVDGVTGFRSANVSVDGLATKVVMPRDGLVYERFLLAGEGASAAAAADIAYEIREQLWEEPWVTVSGRIVAEGLDQQARASVQLVEGTPDTAAEERIPRNQAFPDRDGNWSMRVPPNGDYLVEVEAFGRTVLSRAATIESDTDVGDIDLPGVARLRITGTVDGVPDHLLAFVRPSDEATHDDVLGQFWGQGHECAPLLGEPHSSSPACDRVLVDGETVVYLPPGTYDLYASAGLFSTLATARDVQIGAGEEAAVSLDVELLDLKPPGTLDGDFHIHGGASFDSNIPDDDRVRAFLAANIDVLATTEHDTAWDYADALAAHGALDEMVVMVGTEATGHILRLLDADSVVPKVVGHWNIWPVPFDPEGPWRGAPWDEKAEPGEIFGRAAELGWDSETGIAQLNHPISPNLFGRDQGWASALGIDGNVPLSDEPEGSLAWLFLRTPEGSAYGNADFDTMEVMNGSGNGSWLKYRAFWFYLLNQGILRAGTANSDSHTLTENVVGTPRTLVYTDSTVADFDPDGFHAAMKDARMTGTNGPVLEAFVESGNGRFGPSFHPVPGSGDLHITVRAAPWVPVEEVRIIVNGEVVQTITDLTAPADPFGDADLDRLDVTVPLADLLPSGDAWLVVEAGAPIERNEDLDCDGFPDTGDNNRDGVIDWQDVDGLEEAPEGDCFESVGPLTDPVRAEDRDAPSFIYATVAPDGFPTAFTNPLLFDPDGDGFEGVWQ